LLNSNSSYIQLTIESIREETKGFKTFSFAGDHGLKYQAGQFLTFVDKTGSHEIRRSYSIISSPVLNESLSIAVKRIDNGFFSRKLIDRARVGDRLLTTGAGGFFCLPENIKSFTSIFFFAAGSGIAPILSLLKTAIHIRPKISLFLIYSNQSVETTAFYQELQQMVLKFPDHLHIDFLYSSESDLRRARLNPDLLIEFLKINQFDREKTLFYTCGPESYMRMIIFHLLEEGFNLNQIKKEDFNPGNKKLTTRKPPDKNSHHVELELSGNKYNFPVKYPDSILQAAKKIKLTLPYSCETGKCGSCAAKCISGEVWLSNNEVLTDLDLARGLTLTCTGHPQNGDVVLKIG
jgi:ring-1,2-phenylacetyl-CoA epoxidase subunit PaaE